MFSVVLNMVKSLFNICLAAVSQNNLYKDIAELPDVCKQRLLEFFSSHDQVAHIFWLDLIQDFFLHKSTPFIIGNMIYLNIILIVDIDMVWKE